MIRRQDDGGSGPGDGRLEALSPLARTARLVLEVVPGERRLLPEFGCRVHLLPSISTDADRRLAAALIEEALELWVPSLRVDRADVTSVEDGSIAIALRARGASHALTITHRVPGSPGASLETVEPPAAIGPAEGAAVVLHHPAPGNAGDGAEAGLHGRPA
jgi:phage baseplate assembly protein W